VTRAAGTRRPFSLLVWSSVVAPVPLLGLSLIFEGTGRWQHAASSLNASGIAALAYVVVVSTFFASGTWYRLMSRYPASTVAPFTLLVPVIGILTAWLVRGEHPAWGELLGSLTVLFGLALALGVLDALAVQRRAAAAQLHPFRPTIDIILEASSRKLAQMEGAEMTSPEQKGPACRHPRQGPPFVIPYPWEAGWPRSGCRRRPSRTAASPQPSDRFRPPYDEPTGGAADLGRTPC
jgi:uncharacterized membrane protein